MKGEQQLLADVENSFEGCPDARLREIMQAAVRHLHAFVSEVRLTHDEWQVGINFLTAVGHKCDDIRQEFILLSDILGVSSLTEISTFDGAEGATEATVVGPFHVPGSPFREKGASILEDPDPGTPMLVRGRVTDLRGRVVAGATIDVWQNASNRLYAVQDPNQHPNNLRGKFLSDEDGSFEFRTIRPVPYPIPDDGPVGQLLEATGRHPWRAAHVHLLVTAPGYKTLTTHVFDSEDPRLHSDAVFGVRESLVVDIEDSEEPGMKLARFDVVLDPAD